MKVKKLPKSLRKFIRREKGRIRREFSDLKEQENRIEDMYNKIAPKTKIKKEQNKDEGK